MEKELKQEFEKLGGMMAAGFSELSGRIDETNTRTDTTNNRIDVTNERISELTAELRGECRSIRAELERIPDDIDSTYSKTFNDLLERVARIEKELHIA